MANTDLSSVLTLSAEGACGPADPSWQQGPGLYGGITAAWLAAAMRRKVDPARRLRTLHVQCAAPVPPEGVFAQAHTAREGRLVSVMHADLTAEGRTIATASATFAAPRSSELTLPPITAPKLRPPDTFSGFEPSPLLPAFTSHVDYRFAEGTPPFSGSDKPHFCAWVRFAHPFEPDEVGLAALSDVLPPAIISTLRRPGPVATVDLTIDYLEPLDPTLPKDAWWIIEIASDTVVDGYANESGQIFDPHGRRVATFRQLVAVLG